MRHRALQVLLVPLLLGLSACVNQSDSPATSTAPEVYITDASQLTGFGDITDATVEVWDQYLQQFDEGDCTRVLAARTIFEWMAEDSPNAMLGGHPSRGRKCVEFYFQLKEIDDGYCFPTGEYRGVDPVTNGLSYPPNKSGPFFDVQLLAQTQRTCMDLRFAVTNARRDDHIRVRALLLYANQGWAHFEVVWVGDTL